MVLVSMRVLLVNAFERPSCSIVVPRPYSLALVYIVMGFFLVVISEGCVEESVADPCF